MSPTYTFCIAANVDEQPFCVILSIGLKELSKDQATRIIRVLQPNAQNIETTAVVLVVSE